MNHLPINTLLQQIETFIYKKNIIKSNTEFVKKKKEVLLLFQALREVHHVGVCGPSAILSPCGGELTLLGD